MCLARRAMSCRFCFLQQGSLEYRMCSSDRKELDIATVHASDARSIAGDSRLCHVCNHSDETVGTCSVLGNL
jgi:hypothetical protein